MPTFNVLVTHTESYYGVAKIWARDENDAKQIAQEMLERDRHEFEWDSDEPSEDDEIEVEPVDTESGKEG